MKLKIMLAVGVLLISLFACEEENQKELKNPEDTLVIINEETDEKDLLEATVQSVTIYVDDAYRPISYSEDGVAKGMYIEILSLAASRMPGYDVTFEAVPWQRGKLIMEHGDGLGLLPVYYHGYDWPYIYPYSLPFYTERVIVVGLARENNQPLEWPVDYVDQTIGNILGYDGWGGEVFKEMASKDELTIEFSESVESHVLKMVSNRVDYILMNEYVFYYYWNYLKENDLIDQSEEYYVYSTVGEDDVYIGYSENFDAPYALDFIKKFDNEIFKIIKSGEVDEIAKKYK